MSRRDAPDVPPPPPVPCAGCGELIPYDAGRGPEHPSYGESLRGELGVFYVRTCRRRECVEQARRTAGFDGKGGKPYTWPEPRVSGRMPDGALDRR